MESKNNTIEMARAIAHGFTESEEYVSRLRADALRLSNAYELEEPQLNGDILQMQTTASQCADYLEDLGDHLKMLEKALAEIGG